MQAKAFVGITVSLGIVVLGYSLWHWQSQDLMRFACYAAVAILASGLKVQLPGIDGTMSVNFLFILLGVLELSLPETLLIGCTATLVQSVWQARKRLDPIKVLFNVAGMMANASCLTYLSYHWLAGRLGANKPILLMLAALVFFFANTLPISIVIAMTEGKASRKVWSECYFWSFPYYLVGAAAVGLVGIVNRRRGMANIVACFTADLLGLSLLSHVFGPPRSGKGKSRSREAACRADCLAEHAHHRSAGAWLLKPKTTRLIRICNGYEPMRSKSPRNWSWSRANRGPARGRVVARYRKAGCTGTDHQ